MHLSEYFILQDKINKSVRLAIISDLHGTDPHEAIELLRAASPDVILAPGDIFERVDNFSKRLDSMNEKGFLLLSEAAKIAPTYYSPGNHEIGGTHSWAMGMRIKRPARAEWSDENLSRLKSSGVVFLDDSYVVTDGFAIGGLSSGILNGRGVPNLSWLDDFSNEHCPKILLCHHPEYYEKYLRERDIDIIVSGHAHGGQWRFFGRGIFAPGQGFFPRYTKGVYDNRFVVGTSIKGSGTVPRIFNSPEIVIVNVN